MTTNYKLSDLKDEEIIKIICNTDTSAYSEIIKRYQNRLIRYSEYLTKEDIFATDIVEESFTKAFINLKSFNTSKKFSSWIYRIVHNEAMNFLKKQKKISRFSFFNRNSNNEEMHDEERLGILNIESNINIEDDFIKKEFLSHAKNCMIELPLKYRETLSLYFLEEKSYEEISDILRLPIGTVGTRINRGKIIIKKICQK